MKSKIIVVGDVHGRWEFLNKLIDVEHPDIILACGDFGYWPGYPQVSLHKLLNQTTKIYWCDGNHEHHWKLRDRKSDEVSPGVIYKPRGSTLKLPDGRVAMFFGGAHSIDRAQRQIGIDWFPEEVASQKDIENLPDVKIDIVISHTCPKDFAIGQGMALEHDPTRDALNYLLEKYHPTYWYFSHWHFYAAGYEQGCSWVCLDMCAIDRDTRWKEHLAAKPDKRRKIWR